MSQGPGLLGQLRASNFVRITESDDETGARVSGGVARGARVLSRHARSATDPAPLTSNEFKARVRALLGESE